MFPALPFVSSPLAAAFGLHGVGSFRDAAAFVHALPYGRNRDRSDYRLVLDERRGTCSTKHALLAALAREQSILLELRVGIYLMSKANTPGVGPALAAHGLEAVPEAHCYLVHDGARVDLTHPGTRGAVDLVLLEEQRIAPEDIGERKVSLHQAFVARWARESGRTFEHAWRAREACIAALSARA